ncbi:protein NLRC3-like isoform X1 [Dysidea avara]|uniref:protein NLRC3-like isoform X1 n=2 Tax=Dysidea avara TaxID=196820 RepID=UPI0033215237
MATSTVGQGLEQFKCTNKVSTTPTQRDLQRHVTPQYAVDWREIGVELGLSDAKLREIEVNYPRDVKQCCNRMFSEWLRVDMTASWEKLFTAIESPAVSGGPVRGQVEPKLNMDKSTITDPVKEVSILSQRVAMINSHAQDSVDEDTWPPDQPKDYTPLVLIQHQEQRTKEQDKEMAKLTQTGDIDSIASGQLAPKHHKLDSHETLQHVLNTSTVTKQVAEILTPLEESDGKRFVLIEGAPGIGKSFLLKHIACQWGKKLLLSMFKIVLLVCLRDPNIWRVTSISDLLKIFCKGYTDKRADKISTACSDYLLANDGKDITLLLDGYDELPENLKKNHLITDILNRTTLPLCGIVVSSRPHASVSLRKLAVVRVDILGFTEQERQHYIEQSVKGDPHQIKELTQYLHHHPTISNICFAPLNMTILLFLYQLGIPLPKNSTELHHHFIFQTIRRHLVKSGRPLPDTITDLTTLPEPYKKIVNQLAKLSLEALNNNKLVFTSEHIRAACPDMVATPGGTNGFGLLQAVQHFSLTGKTTTFNFLHLTIQEYLAANYIITDLRQEEEFRLLREQFWSDLHANMFFIYVTLTKGQRSSFKQFLSGGNNKIAISSEFLDDQLKCLRLYRCFKEAGDDRMCKSIEEAEIFNNKEINLSSSRLSATDLECVSLFLTSSSHKQWVKLNLMLCYIQDRGLHTIHKYLKNCDVIINNLWLIDNGLTSSSSSFISDIVLSCKVEVLWISYNHTIGESEELYTMLTHPSSMLTILYMSYTSLSSIAARTLFTAVKDTNKLKELSISHNAITDDVAEDIATSLATNKSLVKLRMSDNPISGEAITRIVQALRGNNTIQVLLVPSYPPAIKDMIRSIEQEINTKRRSQGIQEKLTVQF